MSYHFHNSLGYLSGKLSRLSSQMLERRFKLHGIPVSIEQWRILAMLSEEDGVSISMIAEALFLSLAPVSRQVKSLVDLQLVYTEQGAHDRKQKRVCLTPAGRAMAQRCREWGYEVIVAMFGDLSTEERDALLALLQRCIVHAEQDSSGTRRAASEKGLPA